MELKGEGSGVQGSLRQYKRLVKSGGRDGTAHLGHEYKPSYRWLIPGGRVGDKKNKGDDSGTHARKQSGAK